VTATVLAGAALAATALAVTALAVTALAGAGPVLATGVGLPDGTGPTADAQVTGGAGSAWTAPDTALVILGADTVVAEVARTPDERARGLMFRTAVPDGTGMLFVFPEPSPHSFWMKDTFVALDIAYIDQNQRIVDILPMEPRTTEGYSSSGPALFALEVRQGWFAEHGVKVGDWADIRLPTTPR
jgi:hypothetical protein